MVVQLLGNGPRIRWDLPTRVITEESVRLAIDTDETRCSFALAIPVSNGGTF